MEIKLISIGFGNLVAAWRIVAIISPESAPVKRTISEARSRGQLLDATLGRKTRAVLVMDSGHIVLSALHPETISGRLNNKDERSHESGDDKEENSI